MATFRQCAAVQKPRERRRVRQSLTPPASGASGSRSPTPAS
jgi:hypothetical protein